MDDRAWITELAAWLGTDGVEGLDGIRRWHGEAAISVAWEHVRGMPEEERDHAFWVRIRRMKTWRKGVAAWPEMRFEAWDAGMGEWFADGAGRSEEGQ